VNEGIKEVVSAAIADGLKDPRVGFVTVTGVEASTDFRHAKVFVSVLGGARERAATLEGLKASHGYLQARVNDALRLRHTPQLEFVYDETTDRAMHIEDLLRREAEVLGDEPPVGLEDEEGDEPPTALEDGEGGEEA
jgi:ribosome-binding factor A